jgi:DnaJ-class molecular chaperone
MPSDLHQRIKDAFGVAEPSASDEAGSDLELPVKVTLHEAYLGTTRKFTATLSNGHKHIMELEIPPGVDTGTRVRFRGYGAAGQAGGKPGDLYLVISVSPYPNFARQGNDLFSRLTLPLVLLRTGGGIRVKTLDREAVALTIPAGTKDGQVFQLSGQGMPLLRQPTQRGDLHLEVLARLPGEPYKSEKELLAESQTLQEATTRQQRSPAVKNSQRWKRAGSRVIGHSDVLDAFLAWLIGTTLGALAGLALVTVLT